MEEELKEKITRLEKQVDALTEAMEFVLMGEKQQAYSRREKDKNNVVAWNEIIDEVERLWWLIIESRGKGGK